MGLEAHQDQNALIKCDSHLRLAAARLRSQEGGDETTTVSHQEEFD